MCFRYEIAVGPICVDRLKVAGERLILPPSCNYLVCRLVPMVGKLFGGRPVGLNGGGGMWN